MKPQWAGYSRKGIFSDTDMSRFHVVTCISNPIRFKSRNRLFADWLQHMRDSGIEPWVIEMAHDDRPFEITDPANPRHIQVSGKSELFHKENLINIAVSKFPSDWETMAYIDADVQFYRKDWTREIVEQLKHYQILQPWSEAVDTGPNGETFAVARSFCSRYIATGRPAAPQNYNDYWHTGYAWAMRREAWHQLGGLLDIAILGSADFYMGWALLGLLDKNLYCDVASIPHRKIGFQQNYINRLMQWQDRAKGLKRSIGIVPGTLFHSFHGKKRDRQYNSRENILIDNKYDPDMDLTRNFQHVWELRVENERQIRLRDGIMGYLRSRSEDSTDL